MLRNDGAPVRSGGAAAVILETLDGGATGPAGGLGGPPVRRVRVGPPEVSAGRPATGAPPLSIESVYRYTDGLAALVAGILVMGGGLRVDAVPVDGAGAYTRALIIGGMVWAWPMLGAWAGLYRDARAGGFDTASRVARACVAGAIVPTLYIGATAGEPGWSAGLLLATIAAGLSLALRGVVHLLLNGASEALPRQVVIVGSGPRASALYRQLASGDGAVPVGIVDDVDFGLAARSGLPMLGRPAELERILMNRVVDEVLIALPVRSGYTSIQQAVTACERTGTPSTFVADLFHCAVARPRLEHGVSGPVVAHRVFIDDYRLGLKRVLDVAVAAMALIALAPLMLLIALAVRLSSPGPVIFAQERYGLSKRRFDIYKFRTMVMDAEARQSDLESCNEAAGPVFKIQADPRVTPLGRFLRRTSLDELPQLWNVLRGDMSLVGPRPLPVRDVRRFADPWLMRRFSVRPGITCLWQVGGRNELSFDDWVALDLQYIDRWSFGLDLRILLRTVPAVLSGRGAM